MFCALLLLFTTIKKKEKRVHGYYTAENKTKKQLAWSYVLSPLDVCMPLVTLVSK